MITLVSRTLATVLLLAITAQLRGQETPYADEEAIKNLIVQAYVNGVFRDRDSLAVRAGFHPDFVMSVQTDDGVIVATLDMWLQRLGLDGTPAVEPVEYEFRSVDVTAGTAVVKLDIYQAEGHVYTDYLGLYRFADGWRIVNKVFHSY